MTDITELAQSLKAAAEKATPGPWYVHDKPCEDGNYGIDTSDKEFLAEAVVWWGFARQSIWREEDAKYIAMANPANVLALVEALEKAQAEQVNDDTTGKPLTIILPDISSKAFWSGAGKTETFHPGTYRRWVREAIERYCTIARIDVEVK
ncbi:ead/Ea22-like family protein [Raoultella ornithinolytica]|uniref:ead/Ea22-like family protein n=1 Tax=Raoultella TaxID=160674 RepID=UPI00292AEBCC|nr:ead/Ea22-like family protein [Raoultella ornithinolytica]MDV0588317.1 ead/Ea22-like family protein [Raoultella ornithinolytica]